MTHRRIWPTTMTPTAYTLGKCCFSGVTVWDRPIRYLDGGSILGGFERRRQRCREVEAVGLRPKGDKRERKEWWAKRTRRHGI